MMNNFNRANAAIIKMLEQLPDMLAAATTSEERANLLEKAAKLKKELKRGTTKKTKRPSAKTKADSAMSEEGTDAETEGAGTFNVIEWLSNSIRVISGLTFDEALVKAEELAANSNNEISYIDTSVRPCSRVVFRKQVEVPLPVTAVSEQSADKPEPSKPPSQTVEAVTPAKQDTEPRTPTTEEKRIEKDKANAHRLTEASWQRALDRGAAERKLYGNNPPEPRW